MIGRCVGAKSCLHLQADLATTRRPRARSGVVPAAYDGWADGHALRAAEDVWGGRHRRLGAGFVGHCWNVFLFFDDSGGARCIDAVDPRIPMVRM